MKSVVVTGGCGFLGSHLIDSLVADGDIYVTVLDNLQTGNLRNIAHHDPAVVSFRQHDITDPFDIEASEYWNLSCVASPPKYQRDPLHTFFTNVRGVENVLRCATKYGGRVFQASTSEVYGDPTLTPQPESYRGNVSTTGPRAVYDEGKRAAETLLTEWSRQYGTEVRIARIFNTYGPVMAADDGRVVSNMINQALRGEDITIYGSGLQTRSLCYVSDLIRGFRLLFDSDLQVPVNLGNPHTEMNIIQLAELIKYKTGSNSYIVYTDLPGDDPRQRCPDITIARTLLGWSPEIDLNTGLDRTINYFKEWM